MLTFTILCLFFTLARGLPTLLSRDVVSPPITSPIAGTVWHVGETVTVTWDTSNIPPPSQVSNPIGQIVLGWMASPTDSEHLMLDSPLAQNFPLTDGNASFTVPSVQTRTNYIVVLFGDSGNISPTFTIQGTDSSSSAESTTSSVTPSSATPSSATSSSTTPTTIPTTSSTSASASSPTSSVSEVSVTGTQTSIITESPSTSSAITATPSSSPTTQSSESSNSSSATGSSSSASSSASAAAANTNSNAAWKTSTHQSQVFAFAASLLAAYLL